MRFVLVLFHSFSLRFPYKGQKVQKQQIFVHGRHLRALDPPKAGVAGRGQRWQQGAGAGQGGLPQLVVAQVQGTGACPYGVRVGGGGGTGSEAP